MTLSALNMEKPPRTPDREKAAEWGAREGLFKFHSGAYRKGLEHLSRAADSFFALGILARGIETLVYVLRIHAEQENYAEIARLEKFLLTTLETNKEIPSILRSRVHYMLGLCNVYQSERIELAHSHFEQAIDFAVVAGDRAALAYPLLGLANLHWSLNRHEEAAAQLNKLDTILECVEIPELRASALLLRGLMHRNQGDYDFALQRFWDAYRLLRRYPNVVLYIHVLHALGTTHSRKNEIDLARNYLDLARNAITEEDLPRLKRLVETSFSSLPEGSLRSIEEEGFDFRVEKSEGVIYDSEGKPLPILGRFILRDLALLLMSAPGRVFSKEEIVRLVWNELYDPEAHDNKIYVTIRRLRSLLEASSRSRRTPYILRSKSGYHFDPSAKIKLVD